MAWFRLFSVFVSDTTPATEAISRVGTFRWSSPRFLVISAAVIAASLKLYCASTTIGSCDVPIFSHFGQIIDSNGIDYLYRTERLFNFPPVTGEFVGLLYHFASYLSPANVDNVPRSFPLLLRLPSIFADLLAVLILLRLREKTGKPPLWSLVLFALSPVAFMVSGFHGNVDSVMVCLLLIAAYFCVEEQPLLSGAFLAFACSIKVTPLFLIPVFFFFWLHRGRKTALHFTSAFLVSCLAGWSGALVESSGYFFRHVLGYNSFPGGWGVTYWCVRLFEALDLDLSPQSLNRLSPVLTALKVIIIVSVIALGWLRRKESGTGFIATIALAWTCFVIFAPGFVPYYLIWMAPFVLVYSPVWYVVLTAATSVYLFAYYNMMSHGVIPWNASDPSVPPTWNDWGTIPWFVAVAMGIGALVLSRRSEGNLPRILPVQANPEQLRVS